MEHVIGVLEEDLKGWEELLEYDKEYYKGFYDYPEAISAFQKDESRIAELKKAIEILKSSI